MERNNEGNINFLQNSLFNIQHIYLLSVIPSLYFDIFLQLTIMKRNKKKESKTKSRLISFSDFHTQISLRESE